MVAGRMPGEKDKIFIKTLDQVDLEDWEKATPEFQGAAVVVFPSSKLAIHMCFCFVHQDLVPRVGNREEAAKFPLIRSGPSRDAFEAMDEDLGFHKPLADQETWFLIGNSRFPEFYDYLMNRYLKVNREVRIKDLRGGDS